MSRFIAFYSKLISIFYKNRNEKSNILGVARVPNATGNTKKRSYLQYDSREKTTAPF
jgi:hypothetical protein